MTTITATLATARTAAIAAEVRYATAIEAWKKWNETPIELRDDLSTELLEAEYHVFEARQGFSHELQLARTLEVRAAMYSYLDAAVRSLDPQIENAWLLAHTSKQSDDVTIKVTAGFGGHWANVHSSYPLTWGGLERLIEDIELNWLG